VRRCGAVNARPHICDSRLVVFFSQRIEFFSQHSTLLIRSAHESVNESQDEDYKQSQTKVFESLGDTVRDTGMLWKVNKKANDRTAQGNYNSGDYNGL
jgi:hypothetical protein